VVKDSLYKRVSAIENKGVGPVIRTLADLCILAARELEGMEVGTPTLSPIMQAFVDDWLQYAIEDDLEQAWAQWERWVA